MALTGFTCWDHISKGLAFVEESIDLQLVSSRRAFYNKDLQCEDGILPCPCRREQDMLLSIMICGARMVYYRVNPDVYSKLSLQRIFASTALTNCT